MSAWISAARSSERRRSSLMARMCPCIITTAALTIALSGLVAAMLARSCFFSVSRGVRLMICPAHLSLRYLRCAGTPFRSQLAANQVQEAVIANSTNVSAANEALLKQLADIIAAHKDDDTCTIHPDELELIDKLK